VFETISIELLRKAFRHSWGIAARAGLHGHLIFAATGAERCVQAVWLMPRLVVTNSTGVDMQLVQCVRNLSNSTSFNRRKRDRIMHPMHGRTGSADSQRDRPTSRSGSASSMDPTALAMPSQSGRSGRQQPLLQTQSSDDSVGMEAAGSDGSPSVDWSTKAPLPAGMSPACRAWYSPCAATGPPEHDNMPKPAAWPGQGRADEQPQVNRRSV